MEVQYIKHVETELRCLNVCWGLWISVLLASLIHDVALEPCDQAVSLSVNPGAPKNSFKTLFAF